METDICQILYKSGSSMFAEVSDSIVVRISEGTELADRAALELIDISVTARWLYSTGETITVPILVGETQAAQVVLNSENEWKAVAEDLPAMTSEGAPIEYSLGDVVFANPSEFSYVVNGSQTEGFVLDIRNMYTDVEVSVVWDFVSSDIVKAPVNFDLVGDGSTVGTYSIPANSSTYTISHIPRLDLENLSEILYDVRNVTFTGYDRFSIVTDGLDIRLVENTSVLSITQSDFMEYTPEGFAEASVSAVSIMGNGLSGFNLADISTVEISEDSDLMATLAVDVTSIPDGDPYTVFLTGADQFDWVSLAAGEDQYSGEEIVSDILPTFGVRNLTKSAGTNWVLLVFGSADAITEEYFDTVSVSVTHGPFLRDHLPFWRIAVDILSGNLLSWFKLPLPPSGETSNVYWSEYAVSQNLTDVDVADSWMTIDWEDLAEDATVQMNPAAIPFAVGQGRQFYVLLEVEELRFPEEQIDYPTLTFYDIYEESQLITGFSTVISETGRSVVDCTQAVVQGVDNLTASVLDIPAGTSGHIRYRISLYAEGSGFDPQNPVYNQRSNRALVVDMRGYQLGADDSIFIEPSGMGVLTKVLNDGTENYQLETTGFPEKIYAGESVALSGNVNSYTVNIPWDRVAETSE